MLDELLLLRRQSEKYETLSHEHEELITAYQISKEREEDQEKEIQMQVTGRYNAEQKFRYLSESGLINICFFTIDGKVHSANDSFLIMMGYSKEVLANGNLSLESFATTQSIDQLKNFLQDLNELRILMPHPIDFMKQDGSKVSTLFGAIKIEATSSECVGFIVDISDLKKSQELLEDSLQKIEDSEEFLRSAVNLAELATWTITVQNNRVYFSETLRSWIGLNEDNTYFDDVLPMIHADDRERIRTSLLKALNPASGGTYREHY